MTTNPAIIAEGEESPVLSDVVTFDIERSALMDLIGLWNRAEVRNWGNTGVIHLGVDDCGPKVMTLLAFVEYD